MAKIKRESGFLHDCGTLFYNVTGLEAKAKEYCTYEPACFVIGTKKTEEKIALEIAER